ncbi:hypothetical protein PG984_010226 [Apiospora sp. TS-2023a]
MCRSAAPSPNQMPHTAVPSNNERAPQLAAARRTPTETTIPHEESASMELNPSTRLPTESQAPESTRPAAGQAQETRQLSSSSDESSDDESPEPPRTFLGRPVNRHTHRPFRDAFNLRPRGRRRW